MPGRLLEYIEVNDYNYYDVESIITSNKRFTEDGQLFVVELKGHIDESHINDFINFPPIFRNIDITTNEETIGSYMYNYLKSNDFPVDKHEC